MEIFYIIKWRIATKAGINMRSRLFLFGLIVLCVMQTAHAQADSIAIPVRLSALQGHVSGTAVTLHWTTVCFLQNAYFQVQQSVDGKTFTTVDAFGADRLRCQQPFEWKDTLATTGNIFYKVNVGDADGRYSQSKVVSLVSKTGLSKMIAVYPTLVHATANVVLAVPGDGTYTLHLVSALGMPIKQFHCLLHKGSTYFSLDMSAVAAGTYWLAARDNSGSIHSVAVIKQ